MRFLLKLLVLSLVFLFTAPISFTQVFPPILVELSVSEEGLVGHWTFDELNGTMAYDYSSNGNHGVVDGATWVTGRIGVGALNFDGVSNLVKVPHSASLVFTDQLTIAAWIYLASTDGNQDALQKYGLALCEIRADKTGIISNILKINDVWTAFVYDDNSADFLNQWRHLALTYNGAQVVNYLDGQEDKSFAQTGQITIPSEGESDLSIGSNAPWNDCYFNGLIDDVRLYNRALDEYEIQNLFYGIDDIEQSDIHAHPGTFELYQNYPNPFNPTTSIVYSIPYNTKVTLKVYNILGEEVATLLYNEQRSAGKYEVTFNASDFNSGIYIYQLKASSKTKNMKMMFIK
jgi:hypothetical protein